MWTPEEQKLFDKCTSLIGVADYERGLAVANQLSERVANDPVKSAYVMGCKKAVALYGLGRLTEAGQTFREARDLAVQAEEPVIVAYVISDWSVMLEPLAAIAMVRQACNLCGGATESPDPARIITADIAYFTAMLARHHLRARHTMHTYRILTQARQSLGRYAHSYPRYNDAYLVVLMWERELGGSHPDRTLWWRLRINGLVLMETARQRKLIAAVRLLLRKGGIKRLQANLRP